MANRVMAVRTRLIRNPDDRHERKQHDRSINLKSPRPAVIRDQPFTQRRKRHDTDTSARINDSDRRGAFSRKPFGDEKDVRYHARKSETDRDDHPETNVELP